MISIVKIIRMDLKAILAISINKINWNYTGCYLFWMQKSTIFILHLKNVSTGVEMDIPIVIRTERDIYSTGGSEDWAWGILKPIKVPNQYELSTLDEHNNGRYMDLIVF
ncbi:hypothetical protein T3H97_08780 [Paenibacillus sp. LX16]|nr:hypothetical protein [Paenibacillus sp. LX16]